MIYFKAIERDIPYQTDNTTTGEVAEKLERNYQIVERFFEFIAQDLEKQFMMYYSRENDPKKAFDNAMFLTSNWLVNEFRTYIEQAKHGIKTKASEKRGDPAFIDTTRYYKNMIISLVEE